MVQTISVEKQTTGWFTQGNLYTPNGALGSGTLYTVQTKVVDVYSTGMGLPSIEEGKAITVQMTYLLSESDWNYLGKTVNRPQHTFGLQVLTYGGNSTIYSNDVTGSKPNSEAKTIFVDMGLWNDVFEPILLGMDVKSPTTIEPPSLNDLLGENFEGTVDKLNKDLEKYNSQGLDPGRNTTIDTIPETQKKRDDCSVCGFKNKDSSHVNKTARKINQLRKNRSQTQN